MPRTYTVFRIIQMGRFKDQYAIPAFVSCIVLRPVSATGRPSEPPSQGSPNAATPRGPAGTRWGQPAPRPPIPSMAACERTYPVIRFFVRSWPEPSRPIGATMISQVRGAARRRTCVRSGNWSRQSLAIMRHCIISGSTQRFSLVRWAWTRGSFRLCTARNDFSRPRSLSPTPRRASPRRLPLRLWRQPASTPWLPRRTPGRP